MENQRTWEEINIQLQERIRKIFKDKNIEELSNYKKRKIIFEYICKNGIYDFKSLDNIKNKGKRNPWNDLYTAIDEEPSICNGFSQYYKLLLEKVGIYSLCVCCNDGTEVFHQLNLVKNDDSTFSFDDTTSVIVERGTIYDFFDYDIERAYELNQGKEPIWIEAEDKIHYWCTFSTKYLDAILKRKESPLSEYKEKSGFGLYEPIKSQKKQKTK